MKRWHLAILASVFCSSCTVGRIYQRPTAPTSPAFKELAGNEQWKTATPSDEALKGKWWEVFGDPQLNRLEEAISPNNFSVKEAEARFRQARLLMLLNRADYYPIIGGTAGITQSNRASTGAASNFQLPFNATWEPDLWGRVRLAVESATANAQVSAADLENLRLSLQATLASNYFALLANDMQLTLLNDTIAANDQLLTLTNNRFNGGVASRSDVTLAQTQLFTVQAQATDLGVFRNQLEHAIAVLIGVPPSELAIPRGRITDLPPPIPIGIPSALLERRPDIAAQERLIAAANANIGLARTAYYPRLVLSATAGLTNGNLLNVFTYASRLWSAGPTLSQTIFAFGGRRKNQIALSEAQYDATVAAYRSTVLFAFQQVEDNLSTLRVLSLEAEQQARAVSAAAEALTIGTERYKAGTDSYLNVITTQTILLNNQRNAVTLLQRRMAAAVNLILALGGGWDTSTLPTSDQLRSEALGDPAVTQTVAQPK